MRVPAVGQQATARAGQRGAADNAVDRFLAMAMRFKGQPYLWGGGHTGATFSKPGPVDCSGLVSQAAKMAGIKGLVGWTVPLEGQSRPIPMGQLRPGDLVFRGPKGNTRHVGIYLGNGKVLHAPRTGQPVQLTDADEFHWAARPKVFEGVRGQVMPPNGRPTRPKPAKDENKVAQAGPASTLTMPGAEPRRNTVAPYERLFGEQGYVKDAADKDLLRLASRVIDSAPRLRNAPLGRAIAAGDVSADTVMRLQRFLESRGFDVGSTGVDGKYGPRTHRALSGFLNSQPERTAAATAT